MLLNVNYLITKIALTLNQAAGRDIAVLLDVLYDFPGDQ